MDLTRFKGMKALVVDDHEPMRRLIKSILRTVAVAEIREVGDGREALAELKQFRPDFALVDINMKPMGGIEFIQTLRISEDNDGIAHDMPIIMVTGVEDQAAILEAIRSGADSVVPKPIMPKTLLERIIMGLDNAALRRHNDDGLVG